MIGVKLSWLDYNTTLRHWASAKGSLGMTEMQGNRAVHIAFNRSVTSSLANRFYHLSGFFRNFLVCAKRCDFPTLSISGESGHVFFISSICPVKLTQSVLHACIWRVSVLSVCAGDWDVLKENYFKGSRDIRPGSDSASLWRPSASGS